MRSGDRAHGRTIRKVEIRRPEARGCSGDAVAERMDRHCPTCRREHTMQSIPMHDPSMLREAITEYFPAEKRESLLFIIVGITAVIVALLLIAASSPYVGMAYPLVAVGLIQLAVGATVYFRTGRQVAELLVGVDADPSGTAHRELVRMSGVNRGFVIYRWTEAVLLAAGIVGLALLRESRLLSSAATGVVVQAGLMLLLDLAAEQRARRYVKRIENAEV